MKKRHKKFLRRLYTFLWWVNFVPAIIFFFDSVLSVPPKVSPVAALVIGFFMTYPVVGGLGALFILVRAGLLWVRKGGEFRDYF